MSASDVTGCRVLIVEDEALVCMALEDMLTDLGCTVAGTAARLDQAMSLIQSVDYDAVVLDINLDGKLSYPVADLLLTLGKPFVFSSGYSTLPEEYDGLPRLQKPYKDSDLANLLTQALQGNHSIQSR